MVRGDLDEALLLNVQALGEMNALDRGLSLLVREETYFAKVVVLLHHKK